MYTINALYYPSNEYSYDRLLRWNKRKIARLVIVPVSIAAVSFPEHLLVFSLMRPNEMN
jgi:hypothetical protein